MTDKASGVILGLISGCVVGWVVVSVLSEITRLVSAINQCQ